MARNKADKKTKTKSATGDNEFDVNLFWPADTTQDTKTQVQHLVDDNNFIHSGALDPVTVSPPTPFFSGPTHSFY
jgi:hypothetical protein